MNAPTEQDFRLEILNSLLSSTHREVQQNYDFHKQICDKDPLFHQRLAAWYFDKGDIRDHKELFISTLCMSDFDGHRDVGLALLRKLPPFQLTRVIDFIRGKRNIPRCVRTEVERYLKEREEDKDWFDNAVITGKKHLKRLYAMLHIAPGERAQAILFDNNPPTDSKIYAVKEIAKTNDPSLQAKLLNEFKIPYRIASTIIKQMTPSVIAVLVDSMTSQELINNMGSLQKHGALDNADIKKMVEAKLNTAKTAKNVAALKGMQAVKSAGLSEDLNEKLKEVVDTQVKNKGRIKKNTAILVDKSSSMTDGIELAKQIATLISAAMDAELFVYAFDTMAYPITSNGNEYKNWEVAFRGILAQGGTVPSVAINQLVRNKQLIEQVVMITDEGENQPNNYRNALDNYASSMNIKPYTYIVRVGGSQWGKSDRITRSLKNSGMEVDDYDFNGDYYSLPNLIHYLTRPSRADLLMDIMAYPLPTRKEMANV